MFCTSKIWHFIKTNLIIWSNFKYSYDSIFYENDLLLNWFSTKYTWFSFVYIPICICELIHVTIYPNFKYSEEIKLWHDTLLVVFKVVKFEVSGETICFKFWKLQSSKITKGEKNTFLWQRLKFVFISTMNEILVAQIFKWDKKT